MEQKHHLTLVVSAPWHWRLTFLNTFRIVNKYFSKASSVSPSDTHSSHLQGSSSAPLALRPFIVMPFFHSLFLFSGLDSSYCGVVRLILLTCTCSQLCSLSTALLSSWACKRSVFWFAFLPSLLTFLQFPVFYVLKTPEGGSD